MVWRYLYLAAVPFLVGSSEGTALFYDGWIVFSATLQATQGGKVFCMDGKIGILIVNFLDCIQK
jgi:hypothetical protein